MVAADDFEVDFYGALQALVDETIKELEAIPPERREAHYLCSAATHLARMIEVDAPSVIVERAETILAKRLRQRARARRQAPQA